MAYLDFLFDKRIIERHIEKGLVDPVDYEKWLASLPDRSENAAVTAVEAEASVATASESPENVEGLKNPEHEDGSSPAAGST
jgi:hypothetical protein